MKQRMFTVVFGIALLLVILFFYQTIALNIAVAAVTILSVYEIFTATRNIKHASLAAVCFIFSAVIPFTNYIKYKDAAIIILFTFLFALFVLMLKAHKTVRLEQMALCFLMTILTTVSMTCIVYLRDEFNNYPKLPHIALFYIALVFASAWLTDAGGYIFGRMFGKNKLSPSISPKKTIEGAIGGIVLAVTACMGGLCAYGAYLSNCGVHATLHYGLMFVLSVLCALVSIVGDLSASLLKRENNVKDFGKILPGHGGMLDRFDSIIFVAPLILAWAHFLPIVTL